MSKTTDIQNAPYYILGNIETTYFIACFMTYRYIYWKKNKHLYYC